MNLAEFFQQNTNIALAFSGGVDSAYLLYEAAKCSAKVRAYYVKSVFQPQFELDDALRLASELNADMTVLTADVLGCQQITDNPSDRCYHCKKLLFEQIAKQARLDGYTAIIDGTNASDDAGDRPGMRALQEVSVLSPLRLCGLTKETIRLRSKEAGLFTWDKPAYACLATRIPSGQRITGEMLERTERAEDYLFSLGFTDFRVRMMGECAKLQLPATQLPKAIEKREQIILELKKYYSSVLLDLEVRA